MGEVAQINPRAPKLAPDVEVAFVGMSDLDPERALTRSNWIRPFQEVSKGYTVFADGDILVAKITPCFENNKIGKAQLQRKIGVGSTEFHVLRAGPNVNDSYLLHFLRQERIRRQGEIRMTGSAGQRRVPTAFLQSLPIPLPPLDQQRRIAAILDHADALRTKRRQTLAKLENLAHAIFIDTFGSDEEQSGAWPKATLGELITDGPQNGLYKPSTEYGDGVPIVRIDSFQDGAPIAIDRLKRVKVSDTETQAFTLDARDILINRVNAISHLGKSTIVSGLTETTIFESNMMRIRVNTRRALPEYIRAFLGTASAKRQIRTAAKDAVNQSSINQRDVKQFVLPVPPIKLQQTYLERIQSSSHVGNVAESQLSELDSVFNSLQARAFRGEL